MADALTYLRNRLETGGFNEMMGMRILHLSKGYAEVELPASENNLNALGNVHGGVIFALCDAAAGTAAASYGRVGVTLNSNIHYLRPGKGNQSLFAKTREIKVGRTTAVFEVFVTSSDGTEVADATFTRFYIGPTEELV